MTRICRDCAYCEKPPRPDWGALARCTAVKRVDLVTGVGSPDFCHTQRLTGQECGPEGKLYLPKDMTLHRQLVKSLELEQTPLIGTVN